MSRSITVLSQLTRLHWGAGMCDKHAGRPQNAGPPANKPNCEQDDLAPATGILTWALVGLCLWSILAAVILFLLAW